MKIDSRFSKPSNRVTCRLCNLICCKMKFDIGTGYRPENICKFVDQEASSVESGGLYGMSPTIEIDCINPSIIDKYKKEQKRKNKPESQKLITIYNYFLKYRRSEARKNCIKCGHYGCVPCKKHRSFVEEEIGSVPENDWQKLGWLLYNVEKCQMVALWDKLGYLDTPNCGYGAYIYLRNLSPDILINAIYETITYKS